VPSLFIQFAFYEGAATALESLLSLSTKLGRAREALKCIPSLPEPNWREASDVLRILKVLKAVEARVRYDRDDVQLLRQRRVADLPHADALGADDSFFNIAEIRYSGRIRLREHFRCMPEIIQFSNNLCYPSEPLVPLRQYGMARLAPIVTLHVADGYQKGVSPRITNPPEAEALVSKIAECCGDHRYRDKSMGVISLLGEDQARYIEKLLLETVGPEEMERRKLVCGDAYAFQGDERDVIFLSMVSAPTEGHRIATLGSPRDERRFNVAASRARDQLWLVHTATLNDLSPRCLRYRLLEYCQNPHVEPTAVEGVDFTRLRSMAKTADREFGTAPDPFGSWFEVDVFLDVVGRRYRVIPQMRVAGYSIDLVVEGMEGRVAVECDGDRWHGAERYLEDMARQRQLERCGWTFWRIRGSQYYRDPAVAMQRSGHYLASWASIHTPETILFPRLNPLVFKSRLGSRMMLFLNLLPKNRPSSRVPLQSGQTFKRPSHDVLTTC